MVPQEIFCGGNDISPVCLILKTDKPSKIMCLPRSSILAENRTRRWGLYEGGIYFILCCPCFWPEWGYFIWSPKSGPQERIHHSGVIYSFGREFSLYPSKSLIAPCWRKVPHMTPHNAFGWLLPLICQNLSRSCPSCGKLRASFQGFLENKA